LEYPLKIPENTCLAAALVSAAVMPDGYDDVLGAFDAVVIDRWGGPPVGWGFPILKFIGEPRFESLKRHGEPYCLGWKPLAGPHGDWVLVTHWLTADEAAELYGPVGKILRGPRGGFKGIVYGDCLFTHTKMRPGR
jgi:hypothetical protein